MPDAIPQPSTADTPAPPPPPPPDLTGRMLGEYQLLRRLGSGGMGQVYLARQLSLKREVAVKLLRDELMANDTARKRFQAEAEAVAKLNHPNIVHIHQLSEQDGQRYMVLEYVDGRNLRDHLARKGPPDLPISLSVMRQVALALQNAHDQGIVHRDIKPENILVTRKVDVKVTDFGLSRFFAGPTPALNLTQSGVTLGTPLYMSPEQVQGKPVDHRSDIYSLGVTSYHLLAGEPPFRGSSAFDVALKHVQDQPRPLSDLRPDLPADLCGMVHRMMAKNPDERYQSTREILRDLAKIRDGIAVELAPAHGDAAPPGLSISGGGSTGLPAPGPGTRKGRWGRWALAAGVAAAAAALGAWWNTRTQPSPEPNPEPAAAQPPTIGLPDIRSPDKLVTTRERELLALLANRETKAEDMVNGHIELGLLYLKQHRLDEADARFKKLEGEAFAREPITNRTVGLAGRLGQAVVLAYRDAPGAAQQSNDLVMKVLGEPFGKSPGKFDKGYQTVLAYLLRHPDLAQAVSDALNRNAVALGKAKLEPAALEQLRQPPRGVKKD